MKIAIIGDLHFGIKSNNFITDNAIKKALVKVFDYILKHNIKHVVQLGDIFENRKHIYANSGLSYVDCFLRQIIENNLYLYQLLGNHDILFDNDNDINSLEMFFSLVESDRLQLIDKLTEIKLSNRNLVFLPYAFSKDLEIDNLKGDVLFGHLSIDGFEIQKDIPVQNGLKQSNFSGFRKVISGHLHRRKTIKNITYVGSLVENNFGENDYIHGFYVLDLETLALEFIPIDERIFIKIKGKDIDSINDIQDKIVEIEFDKENEIEIDNCIEKIQNLNPENIRIKYTTKSGKIDITIEDYDFVKLLKEYIDKIDLNINREKLFQLIMKILEKTVN